MSPPAPQTLTAISSGVVLASQIVKRHVPLGTWGASCPTAGCRGRGASVASCALRRRLECLGREGTTRRRGEARAPMPPEFCVTTRKQAFQRSQKIKKDCFQRKTYMPRCAHISLSPSSTLASSRDRTASSMGRAVGHSPQGGPPIVSAGSPRGVAGIHSFVSGGGACLLQGGSVARLLPPER